MKCPNCNLSCQKHKGQDAIECLEIISLELNQIKQKISLEVKIE